MCTARGPGWSPLSANDTLVPSAPDLAELGSSVVIDGDTAVVAARDYDSRGAVFVYSTGSDGKFKATPDVMLQSTDIAPDDLFGASVALSGDA